MAPVWLRWTLAFAMVAVTTYHLSRLRVSRLSGSRTRGHEARPQLDVELTHAAMGAAMTLMVLNALAPADLRGIGVLFVAPAAWFATRSAYGYALVGPRGADGSARQLVGCAGMAYMLLALAARSSIPARTLNGMSMSGSNTSEAGVFSAPAVRVIVIAGIVVLCGWTIARSRRSADNTRPALGLACQLAVNATTVYMLAAM